MNAAPQDVDKLTQAIHHADGAAESMAKTMQDNLEGELEELMSALEEVAISFGDILMPAVRAIVRGLNDFVNGINALPGSIKGVVAVILVLVAAIGPLLIIVGQMMNGLGAILMVGPKLIGVFSGIASFLTGSLIPAIGSVIAIIGPIPLLIGGIIGAIALLWANSESFRENVKAIWASIQKMTVQAREAISQFLSTTWTYIFTEGSQIWQNLTEYISDALQFLSQFFSQIWQGIVQIVQSAWQNMVSIISNTLSAIGQTISNVWHQITSFISQVLSQIVSIVVNGFNSLLTSSAHAMSSLVDIIVQGFNGAVNFISQLIGQAGTWGWDLIIGIANGINQAIGHLVNSVRNVADIIWSYLHFSVPEIGPLTDYESWMPDFMEGLAKGIDQSRHLVKDAMTGVAQEMILSPQLANMGVGHTSHPIASSANQSGSTSSLSLQNSNGGDIVIPVYLGGNLLDEVIVNAQMRQNLRSGGR